MNQSYPHESETNSPSSAAPSSLRTRAQGAARLSESERRRVQPPSQRAGARTGKSQLHSSSPSQLHGQLYSQPRSAGRARSCLVVRVLEVVVRVVPLVRPADSQPVSEVVVIKVDAVVVGGEIPEVLLALEIRLQRLATEVRVGHGHPANEREGEGEGHDSEAPQPNQEALEDFHRRHFQVILLRAEVGDGVDGA